MKPFPRHKNEFAKRTGCQIERMRLGYDIVCQKGLYREYYLLRALSPTCSVNIGYQTFKEAREYRSGLIIYDPETLEEIIRLEYPVWRAIVLGTQNRRIHYVYRDCQVKITLTPGPHAKKICMIVSKRNYERIMRKIKMLEDWDSLFDDFF